MEQEIKSVDFDECPPRSIPSKLVSSSPISISPLRSLFDSRDINDGISDCHAPPTRLFQFYCVLANKNGAARRQGSIPNV